MIRLLLLAWLMLVPGCRDEDRVAPYLGPYYGGFDTAMTTDPDDDLNANECARGEGGELCRQAHGNPLSHLLLKLARNDHGELTLALYRSRLDYTEGRAMYLS